MAVVTETYPPEVNGVARTLARMVEGLHSRGHDVQLVRPQQSEPAIEPRPRFEQVLVRSMPIPLYPQLRLVCMHHQILSYGLRYNDSPCCPYCQR